MDEDEKKAMLGGMEEMMQEMIPFYRKVMPELMDAILPGMQPVMDAWSKSMATAIADEFERRGLKA
jgi:hypothetical protein